MVEVEDQGEEIELISLDESTSPTGNESGECTSVEDFGAPLEVLDETAESPWRMLAQALPSTLVAGLGMVAAGIVLNIVQDWDVFKYVSELFILIPALLGLKGNLEMTLASRLSTQANLGNMRRPRDILELCFANLALVQVQSGVVAVFASTIAIVVSVLNKSHVVGIHCIVLFCAASVTSFLTALILGSLTCVLVTACHRFNINPDNVAAPLAASMGDVTTLSILAGSAHLLYSMSVHGPALLIALLVLTLVPVPVCSYLAWKSRHTNEVMKSGWAPVMFSMAISSCGGFVLDRAVVMYDNMSTFTPLVNGIGGNLVAIHASRLSTFLHKQTMLHANSLSDAKPDIEVKPVKSSKPSLSLFKSNKPSLSLSPAAKVQYKMLSKKTFKVLIALLAPAHLVFFTVIGLLKSQVEHGEGVPAFFFVFVFLASLTQVLVLLVISHWLVHFQWRSGRDPDSCTIPYLTAIGDLMGTALLALAFFTFSGIFAHAAANLPTDVTPTNSTSLPWLNATSLPWLNATALP
eukprot:scpid44537/ scgid4580/ Solute carrier family 41 member 1